MEGPSEQHARIVGGNSYQWSSPSIWKKKEYFTNSLRHTPQQNGVAERANHTVAEAARAMLQSASMTNGFWECAVATATHVRNHAPSRVNEYQSPHEQLLGQKPDLSYLWTFGCLAYAHTMTNQTKSDATSQKLVFVGYNC